MRRLPVYGLPPKARPSSVACGDSFPRGGSLFTLALLRRHDSRAIRLLRMYVPSPAGEGGRGPARGRMRGELATPPRVRTASESSPLISRLRRQLPPRGKPFYFSSPPAARFPGHTAPANVRAFPRGGRWPRPRPRPDEGRACDISPCTGCLRKLAPHPSPAAAASPAEEAFLL